jgi:hypothetical protein
MATDDKAVKQYSLPFPPTPSASIAGRTMQESVYGLNHAGFPPTLRTSLSC